MNSYTFIFLNCLLFFSCSSEPKTEIEKEKMEVVVITKYKNANSLEIEHLISQPLEDALHSIKEVTNVNSVSSEGLSVVTVNFSAMDIHLARQLVLKNIQKITTLPEDAYPELATIKPSHFCFKTTLYGSDLKALHTTSENIVNELHKLGGIKSIETQGDELHEYIAVEFDREKLASLGISRHDATEALKDSSIIKENNFGFAIHIKPEMKKLEDYGSIVIALKDNEPIYLKDIAIIKTEQGIKEILRENSKRVINIFISLENEVLSKQTYLKIESIVSRVTMNSGSEITNKIANIH